MSVHDLKAGMIGTATIPSSVKMTPVTVKEIKDGTVVQATGSEIVVQTKQGTQSVNRSDLDPDRGVSITRAGKAAQMSEVRVGDRLTATIITAVPQQAAAERPAQPSVEPRAQAEPTPAPRYEPEPSPVGTSGFEPTQEATTAEQLPRTASALPLTGVLGVSALVLGAMLAARRRRMRA
jgi:LPXTG-motif cell wall-anchored protein